MELKLYTYAIKQEYQQTTYRWIFSVYLWLYIEINGSQYCNDIGRERVILIKQKFLKHGQYLIAVNIFINTKSWISMVHEQQIVFSICLLKKKQLISNVNWKICIIWNIDCKKLFTKTGQCVCLYQADKYQTITHLLYGKDDMAFCQVRLVMVLICVNFSPDWAVVTDNTTPCPAIWNPWMGQAVAHHPMISCNSKYTSNFWPKYRIHKKKVIDNSRKSDAKTELISISPNYFVVTRVNKMYLEYLVDLHIMSYIW